jgi:hypothetical protein
MFWPSVASEYGRSPNRRQRRKILITPQQTSRRLSSRRSSGSGSWCWRRAPPGTARRRRPCRLATPCPPPSIGSDPTPRSCWPQPGRSAKEYRERLSDRQEIGWYGFAAQRGCTRIIASARPLIGQHHITKNPAHSVALRQQRNLPVRGPPTCSSTPPCYPGAVGPGAISPSLLRRDRGFESSSLQGRVLCEPAFFYILRLISSTTSAVLTRPYSVHQAKGRAS